MVVASYVRARLPSALNLWLLTLLSISVALPRLGAAQADDRGAKSAELPRPRPLSGRFSPLRPVEAGGKTYYPYSFDGHVHTHHSPDAFHPPAEVLGEAERLGLDAIVITDHGSSRARLEFRGYKGRIVPFVGQEIGGPFGHAVFWNVDEKQVVVPANTSLAARAAYAHARGGLIVLCHPGWWISGRAEDPMGWITPEALAKGGPSGDIDALELWNGVYDKPLRRLIEAWERALEAQVRVPIVGNSDFHRLGAHRIGGPRNVVYCEQPSPELCLWDAVKRGRLYVSDGPSFMLTVNDAPLGATLAPPVGAPLRVAIRASSLTGGELRLYVGREIVQRVPLVPREERIAEFAVPAPAMPSYVRAEIVQTAASSEQVLLLSNPIYLTRE
jgi:hypothetical protein